MKVALLDTTSRESLERTLSIPGVTAVKSKAELRELRPEVVSVAYSKFAPDGYPYVRAVINRSMGRDHINVAACDESGVLVRDIGDFCSDTVCKFVMGLMTDDAVPVVVGIGRIGVKVLEACKKRYSRVFVLHHYATNTEVERVLPYATHITLHLPLTKESLYWFGAFKMSRCKNIVLINTARGKLVKTSVLEGALNAGNISQAYLDVVERSFEIAVDPRVVLTKHVAYLSPESAALRDELTAKTIQEVLNELRADPGQLPLSL